MLPTNEARRTRKPRGMTLFPGIQSAATELGVHRITLYRVLKGQYPDLKNLKSRYTAWLARQPKDA